MKYRIPHLKLGTTSFLIQDYYIPAVKFVASVCDDIALLVSGDELITEKEVDEISRIAAGEGAEFNIHLPPEVSFDTEESAVRAVETMRKVVERVSVLNPHSWVLHISYDSLSGRNSYPSPESVERTAEALREIASFLPSPEHLTIENLETFPIDFWDKWLKGTAYSRCFDIGHVWKDGLLPEDYWPSWSSRVRMCHLHGLGTRDHQSLIHMPAERLDAIMHRLWTDRFEGVITLEVFNFPDFESSHQALLRSRERYEIKKDCLKLY